jgi:NitT/TauT family transport system permease protein
MVDAAQHRDEPRPSRPPVAGMASGGARLVVVDPSPAPRPTPPAATMPTPSPWRRWRPVLLQRARAAALGMVSLSVTLLVWHLATRYRIDVYVRFTNIPSPGDVFDQLVRALQSPTYVRNILTSLQRIFIGFAFAAVVGIALGIVIGWYRLARQLVFPTLEVLRPIPAIAWVPMSIMLWPTAEGSMVFITFLGSFFPILLNTMHGVSMIDPVLVRAARSLGASPRALMVEVVLPGVLPYAFTGLSVGMGVAWVSLIAAEMISGQFGIGYFTWEAYSLIQYADIAVGMVTIGVLGLVCSGGIRALGRICMPWIRIPEGAPK